MPVLGLHSKVSGLFHWVIMVLYMCVRVLCIHTILFICLFLFVLGLLCCTDFSLVVASRSHSPAVVHEFLFVVASCCGTQALGAQAAVVGAHGLMWLPSSRTQAQ